MRRNATLGAVIVFFVLWFGSSGQASANVLGLDVHVGTTFPISVGAQATYELPFGLQLTGEIGWMPRAYVDFINAMGQEFGWYDETTAVLISSSLENSFILRAGLGFRPWDSLGLEFFGGYTLATLGGSVAGTELIEATTGIEIPDDVAAEVPLASTAHAFQLGVGWRFTFAEIFVLRVSLAYFQIVGSSTSVEMESETRAGQESIDRIESGLDAYLNDIYTTYVKTPSLGVYGGFAF